jgi:hypothetical protein
LKKSIVENGCEFSLCALEFIVVSDRNRAPGGRSILSLDLNKAKYSIRRMSMVEKVNVSALIHPNNFTAREKGKSTRQKLSLK